MSRATLDNGPMPVEDRRLSQAIARAAAFIAGEQHPDGGFVEQVWNGDSFYREQATIFAPALLAHCLASVPEAAAVRTRTLDFLERETGPHGIWKFPASSDHCHRFFPPDVDDTACASAALRDAGRPVPSNLRLLLANRNRDGLFYTWFTWRPRWAGLQHLRLVLPQLRHLDELVPLFTRTAASIYNVDAVVNANALHCLGHRPETAAIAPYLIEILRRDAEETSDTWYFNRFMIWYFLSRALAPASEEGRRLIAAKLAAAVPGTPLEAALALSSRFHCNLPDEPALVAGLLDAQQPSGGWPAERVYRGEDFWWGSAAQTTGFIVEALARHRACRLRAREAREPQAAPSSIAP